MHFIDWAILVGLLALMVWAAYQTKKYTRSVADFLAANRCAGRYIPRGRNEPVSVANFAQPVATNDSFLPDGKSTAVCVVLIAQR